MFTWAESKSKMCIKSLTSNCEPRFAAKLAYGNLNLLPNAVPLYKNTLAKLIHSVFIKEYRVL